ncbi:MAG TPA: glycosyltransferase family 2 protein [Candidatus Paceibacterota bacterium]|nr:glycosyltransferase family 2 protein [Candidatus Paceibacterota bacterium]
MKPLISIVVPVYNEEGNVANLYRELREVMDRFGEGYELIFVNDGSTDGTHTALSKLTGSIIVDLARNYGQSTALDAGFRAAKGEIIVSLDGDGQNDPHDIPKLLEALTDPDVDVVAGWRVERKDRRGIRVLTVLGRRFRGWIIGDQIHDSGCTLRAYRRAAVESVDLFGEMHRFLLALFVWKGFRVIEIPVNHRSRKAGISKYGYSKAVRAAIDMIYIWFLYRYSERPLHLFGYLGFTTFGLGLVSLGFTLHDKLALGLHLNRDGWFFLTFFFFIVAVILFSFGLVIDLLMRIYTQTSPREKRYHVRRTYTAS